MPRPRWDTRIPPAEREQVLAELDGLIRSGATVSALEAWAAERGIGVGRTALQDRRREVLGAAAEDPGVQVARRVAEAARAPAPRPRPVEPREAEEENEGEETIDHGRLLRDQLDAAKTISTEDPDPKNRLAAAKLVLQLSRELQEMERAGDGERGPRVVFYFPEKMRIEMDDGA